MTTILTALAVSAIAHAAMADVSFDFALSFDMPENQVVKIQTQVIENTIATTKEVPVSVVVPDQIAEEFSVIDISFTKNSSALNEDAMTVLDDIATAINSHPSYTLSIEGKASSDGDTKLLAHQRAYAVVAYLTSKDVDAKKLRAVSVGLAGEPNDPAIQAADFVIISMTQQN